jgi:hypothetical protein
MGLKINFLVSGEILLDSPINGRLEGIYGLNLFGSGALKSDSVFNLS